MSVAAAGGAVPPENPRRRSFINPTKSVTARLVGDDEAVLRQLGYKQVLYRTWGVFTAVTISISAMSILTSVPASFATGLTFGGPAVMVWGWVFVSACMGCVALGMAELASAFPTSGGMYYYQYRLAGKRVGPLACWVTGWLNVLGQIAAVSAVAFLLSGLIETMIYMASSLPGHTAVEFTPAQELGIYGGCLFLVAVLNSCGLGVLTVCTQLGGIFHLVGVSLLVLMVPLMATEHQSATWVFTHFETAQAEAAGITNVVNVAVLGLLLPAYSFTGMDGPAHMCEEVANASMGPPMAILYGWAVMAVGGLAMVIALLFSITSIDAVLNGDAAAGGDPVGQILYDASVQRFGTGHVGVGLMIIVVLGVFFCLVATLTYVSRILFSYARDRAVPFSGLWKRVDPVTKGPTIAVWGVTVGAFCLGLPMLGSVTAFSAILSLSTISLIVVYVTPITARISWGRKYFVPGPFNLGWWAYPCGIVSTLWALFAAVVFCLPVEMPVSAENLNYAAIAFSGTITISLIAFYFPHFGAYKWFTGPVHEVDDTSSSSDVEEQLRAKSSATNGAEALVIDAKDVSSSGSAATAAAAGK